MAIKRDSVEHIFTSIDVTLEGWRQPSERFAFSRIWTGKFTSRGQKEVEILLAEGHAFSERIKLSHALKNRCSFERTVEVVLDLSRNQWGIVHSDRVGRGDYLSTRNEEIADEKEVFKKVLEISTRPVDFNDTQRWKCFERYVRRGLLTNIFDHFKEVPEWIQTRICECHGYKGFRQIKDPCEEVVERWGHFNDLADCGVL